MLNRITITGRLVADPELRTTQSNTPVYSFRIANDRDFSKNGEKETDFLDVVAWRGTAEFICKYFTKGRLITVDGRLQTIPWKDKQGNNRIAHEILVDNAYFGDSKPDSGAPDETFPAGGQFSGGLGRRRRAVRPGRKGLEKDQSCRRTLSGGADKADFRKGQLICVLISAL